MPAYKSACYLVQFMLIQFFHNKYSYKIKIYSVEGNPPLLPLRQPFIKSRPPAHKPDTRSSELSVSNLSAVSDVSMS